MNSSDSEKRFPLIDSKLQDQCHMYHRYSKWQLYISFLLVHVRLSFYFGLSTDALVSFSPILQSKGCVEVSFQKHIDLNRSFLLCHEFLIQK